MSKDMLPNLPKNLPNQAAAFKPQSEYAKNGKEMAALDKFMRQQMEGALEQYRKQNPALDKNLGYSFQGHPYMKRSGSHVIIPTILRYVCYPNGLTKTKAAILESVREALPQQADYIHDNIWYRPLKPALWKKLQQVVIGNSTKPISINGCKNLDAIRDRLIAASVAESVTFSTKVSVTIDAKRVVIGKKIYTIISNTAKGKSYPIIRTHTGTKKQSLNVSTLKAFLKQD